MPDGLNSSDRRLLGGAGVVVLLLLAGSLAYAPNTPEEESPVPSTYSSTSGGARAAYLLLEDLGYDEHRWEEPPAGLAELGRGALLILAAPTDKPTMPEMESLWSFVSNGGRVLFCGGEIRSFFPEADVSELSAGRDWKEFTPSLPSAISRDARTVVMQPTGYWGRTEPSQLRLYGGEDSASVVDWRIGSGQLLWWAGATPLTNAGITRADNLKLLLNSIAAAEPAGGHATVYWDEYFHGQRTGLWGYFQRTPLIWGLAQLTLVAMGVLFTFSRRSGPVVPAPVFSRLAPLEFVETMGGLYERAGAASVAVAVPYRHFRFELARRLGMPVAAADADLARAAG